MRTKLLAAVFGLAVAAAGCVGTADKGQTPSAGSYTRDRIEAQYPRPMGQVYQASMQVIQESGTVTGESTAPAPGAAADDGGRTIEGKVKQCTVWIRVRQIDPQVTSVIVQTRNAEGGSDMDLAATIDKQIDLRLRR